jgi:hypothetical protein
VTDADLELPRGAVLLHLGPYKTGTTAIQSALHQHRDDLRTHDVLYPGNARRQVRPVFAVTGRTLPGIPPVPMAEWDAMVDEVRRTAAARTVISSEDFVRATPEHVDRIVADLGRDHVHVLMVARPLDRLLPSAWQQRVKSIGETRAYDEWLREVLDAGRAGESARTFWRNQGTAELVTAWTRVLPPEQVVVVVADPTDRGQLRGVLESMLGLPPGLLTEGPQANTSLSWERVELYRRVNQLFKDHGWDPRWQRRLLHGGMLQPLRDAPATPSDRPIPQLSAWAAARVSELAEEQAAGLASSGAVTVGDPDWLRVPPPAADAGDDDTLGQPPTTIPIESAVRAIEGLLDAMHRQRGRAAKSRKAARKPIAPRATATVAQRLDGVGTRTLVREVARRAARRGR